MGCLLGCSADVPAGTTFSTSACLLSFSECDPITHSISILCQETSNIVFHDSLAVQSIISIPSSVIPDGTLVESVEVLTAFDHTFVADLEAFLWHGDVTTNLFGNDVGNGGCAA